MSRNSGSFYWFFLSGSFFAGSKRKKGFQLVKIRHFCVGQQKKKSRLKRTCKINSYAETRKPANCELGKISCSIVVYERVLNMQTKFRYIFMAIYVIEATIKIIGRGFVLHHLSYLRDPWNWIDFVIIVNAYVKVSSRRLFLNYLFNQLGSKITIEAYCRLGWINGTWDVLKLNSL